jgi:hypothetical protein
MFFLMLISAAFGQTNSVPPGSDVGSVAVVKLNWVNLLTPIIVPLLLAGMKQVIPIIPGWALPLCASGLGAAADICLAGGNGEKGAGLGLLGVGLREMVTQVKTRVTEGPKNGAPTVTPLLIAFALIGTMCVPACRQLNPSGVYKGDDILYRADLTITTSYQVMHTFVKWEYENRVVVAKWPEIKHSADVVRLNAKQWLGTAIALRQTYSANPTAENRTSLETALAVLQTAMNQATAYMLKAQSVQPEQN